MGHYLEMGYSYYLSIGIIIIIGPWYMKRDHKCFFQQKFIIDFNNIHDFPCKQTENLN